MKLFITLAMTLICSVVSAQSQASDLCMQKDAEIIQLLGKIDNTAKSLELAMDQVDKDMNNKDLLCMRDHLKEVLGHFAQYVDSSNEIIKISEEAKNQCTSKYFAEINEGMKEAVYKVAFTIAEWETTLDFVTAAAENKGITAEQKCSISLQK